MLSYVILFAAMFFSDQYFKLMMLCRGSLWIQFPGTGVPAYQFICTCCVNFMTHYLFYWTMSLLNLVQEPSSSHLEVLIIIVIFLSPMFIKGVISTPPQEGDWLHQNFLLCGLHRSGVRIIVCLKFLKRIKSELNEN